MQLMRGRSIALAGGILVAGCLTSFRDPVEVEKEAAVGVGASAGTGGSGGATTGGSGGGGAGGAGALGGSAGTDASVCGDPDASTPVYDVEIAGILPSVSMTVDGICDEPAWNGASLVAFGGTKTSDNTGGCRLLWAEGAPDPDLLYGCCEIGDTNLQSNSVGDAGAVWDDDAIEVFLRGDLSIDALGAGHPATTKLITNLVKNVYDIDFSPDPWDRAYDGNVAVEVVLGGTLNDSIADTGYTVEWRQYVGFDVSAPHFGRCAFAIDDEDAVPDEETHWIAFGDNINDPSQWGTCRFGCP